MEAGKGTSTEAGGRRPIEEKGRRGQTVAACRRWNMEIGWPTNVRHVAHVTFDRFRGFLGLPVELEPEVPRKAPSASANVFGVSIESMQCSRDSRGNSVPAILLLMQRHLYEQGGLQAEGIFRINAENSQEDHAREHLNRGTVPDGIHVHCLAGLIKAWFRELPTGILDALTPEQVMGFQTEEECAQLVKLLPPTEASLLDWAVNLMADVVQEKQHNKMNAHNVAMVFAPNMSQMADPLTALMHAVQVMNFLKTLILRTLRERQECVLEAASASHSEALQVNGHGRPCINLDSPKEEETGRHVLVPDEPPLENPVNFLKDDSEMDDGCRNSNENAAPEITVVCSCNEQPCELLTSAGNPTYGSNEAGDSANSQRTTLRQTGNFGSKRGSKEANRQAVVRVSILAEKSKGVGIMGHISSRIELVQAWWWW
ncbi:hypothetical protein Taro_005377 [Colocasia esculenta]|uniref:Uncharacterized protein n=1 Tax=Colocasia esculenta TaxID=4460 RepID=A0A843TKR4_COLES|nr:hypothetical protein [Colocasia esculenta]